MKSYVSYTLKGQVLQSHANHVKIGGWISMVIFTRVWSIGHVIYLITFNFFIIFIHNQQQKCVLGLKTYLIMKDPHFSLVTTLLGGFNTDCWRGYRYSLNCKSNNNNIPIFQHAYLLVSDILSNLFPNVTLYYIDKSSPLLGRPLPGGRKQNPCIDGKNHCTS